MLSQKLTKSLSSNKTQSFKIVNPWNIDMYLRISSSTQMLAFGYYPDNLFQDKCFNILLEKPYQDGFSVDVQFTENQIKGCYQILAISFPKLNNNYLKFFTLLHENGLIK
tara:strand:+ start:443 stop:772 length:330 start_codon:yes stop_codon:yes gene_type:complete